MNERFFRIDRRLLRWVFGLSLAACSQSPNATKLGGTTAGTTCPVSGQTACGASCVSLASDPSNCGTCGTSCGPGGLCSAGQCSCQAGLTRCNDACVDLQSNGEHCGSCDNACSGQFCSSGTCQDSCPAETLECGSSCVTPATDALNCGGCNVVCSAQQSCQGSCVCQAGLTACGDECVDVQGDGQHCGRCDNACAVGELCSAGVCQGGSGVGGSSGLGGATTATAGGLTSNTTGSGGLSMGGSGGSGMGASTMGGMGGSGTAGGGSSLGGATNTDTTGQTTTGQTTSGQTTTGGSGGSASSAACPGASASELSVVSAWLNDTSAQGALPQYAYDNIEKNFPAGDAFDELACSIAASCAQFAPMETDWLRKCEAVITSAIVAESSYNPDSVVMDSYSTRDVSGTTANDPTVGLLQIRFSSTVHDYNFYGPLDKMATIGCEWPSALTSQSDTATWWASQGGTTYLSFMQGVSCNVALATWYYFYNATGNGGQSAVWISNYCSGQGVAGNMVVGLLSHLMGGNYPRPADANNAYPWGIECCPDGNPDVSTCTGCNGRFAAMMGIGTSNARPNPDPFQEALAPEPSKYCR